MRYFIGIKMIVMQERLARLVSFMNNLQGDNQSAIVSGLQNIIACFAEMVATAQLATISNADAVVTYAYTPDRQDFGYTVSLANGNTFTCSVTRDAYRRSLVTSITNVFNGAVVNSYDYAYDALGRPVSRNNDTFGYNPRSEVTSATVHSNAAVYAYDDIGNFTSNSVNSLSIAYAANNLNQYTQIDTKYPVYDLNGNLLTNGVFSFAYDAADRLSTVLFNNVLLQANHYDTQSRRVRKVTPEATHTYFYDGWNLVEERVAYTNGATETIQHVWGKDLSGTLQGAGGVSGLLWLKRGGALYFPCYDNNGNVTAYVDVQGNVVASYIYDAFGNTVSQSGELSDTFHHRFSTKYHDTDSDLYYYGYRFYSPSLSRWLNRDPIEEDGGVNLYAFCGNSSVSFFDIFGLRTYTTGMELEPDVTFDEDFVFDSSEQVHFEDRLSWLRWHTQLIVAESLGHLADATRLYRHYLSGTGEDMIINYEKAYKEDANVRKAIRDAIIEAQKEAERLSDNNPRKFNMCSDAGGAGYYPETENWQKAIGAHLIWGYAVVDHCGNEFKMTIRLHELDRYNFNRGASDIVTGTPDDANGRFAVLGWAQSFLTRGTIERTVAWERGDIPNSTTVTEGRSHRGRGRGRARGR